MARRFKGKPVSDKNEMDIRRVSDALCSWTAACLRRRRTRHSRIIQKRHSAAPCRFYDDNISTVRHSCFYSFRRFEDKVSSCGGGKSWVRHDFMENREEKSLYILNENFFRYRNSYIWYWRVVYSFDICFVHFSIPLVFHSGIFFFRREIEFFKENSRE